MRTLFLEKKIIGLTLLVLAGGASFWQGTIPQSSAKEKTATKSTLIQKGAELGHLNGGGMIASLAEAGIPSLLSNQDPAATQDPVPESSQAPAVVQPSGPSQISESSQPAAAIQESSPSVAAPAPSPVLKNKMEIRGVLYDYYDGGGSGQSIIDSNSSAISTWGGASLQNSGDGLSTHFIGHNPGVFSVLLSLGQGDTITVYDYLGQVHTYTVYESAQVNDYADLESNPSVNYWNRISGTGGGEQIVLQTCLTETTNLVVFAR